MPGRRKAADSRPQPRNFVRAWRDHRDLTLEQLAEKTGLAVGTIGDIERHRGDCTTKTLKQIADALELPSVGDLFRDPAAGADIFAIWETLSPRRKDDLRIIFQHLSD